VATSNTSGNVKTSTLRVFNNSYAVYLVNNSTSTGGGSGIWTTMLNTLGYLYDQWDMAVTGADPALSSMAGFDILIWETGYRTSALPGAPQIAIMQGFVDTGGSLFFTSQAFLNSLNNVPNAFTQNYLGIASWTLDTGYTSLLGVAADPIGDGLNMPLSFQFPSFNKGDNAVPSTATTGVRGNENSSALIHNVYNDSKVVFMSACYNAISTTDADPNNQAAFLGRILAWLEPAPPRMPTTCPRRSWLPGSPRFGRTRSIPARKSPTWCPRAPPRVPSVSRSSTWPVARWQGCSRDGRRRASMRSPGRVSPTSESLSRAASTSPVSRRSRGLRQQAGPVEVVRRF